MIREQRKIKPLLNEPTNSEIIYLKDQKDLLTTEDEQLDLLGDDDL